MKVIQGEEGIGDNDRNPNCEDSEQLKHLAKISGYVILSCLPLTCSPLLLHQESLSLHNLMGIFAVVYYLIIVCIDKFLSAT